MPIIKSAKKKLRKDRKREKQNDQKRRVLKTLIKQSRRTPSQTILQQLFSKLDKAVKTKLIHPNKSARLKSRLSKKVTPAPPKKTTKKS